MNKFGADTSSPRLAVVSSMINRQTRSLPHSFRWLHADLAQTRAAARRSAQTNIERDVSLGLAEESTLCLRWNIFRLEFRLALLFAAAGSIEHRVPEKLSVSRESDFTGALERVIAACLFDIVQIPESQISSRPLRSLCRCRSSSIIKHACFRPRFSPSLLSLVYSQSSTTPLVLLDFRTLLPRCSLNVIPSSFLLLAQRIPNSRIAQASCKARRLDSCPVSKYHAVRM